jgi:hypothetical protein
MHPQSFHRLAPIIAAVEREASGWFGLPVDAVTPGQHIERPSSDLLLLWVKAGARTEGVSVRVWRVGTETIQERRRVEERVRREFLATTESWRAFAANESVGCVRPLGYFPEHLAIATEVAPGRQLSELLQRVLLPFASKADRVLFDRVCHRLADWLRQFHERGRGETQSDAAALTEYVDSRLRRLVGNPFSGFTEADRVRVLLVTAWLTARLQPEDLSEVLIHDDLTPDKVVVSDHKLTMLDCGGTRRGLAHHDLAKLHMHVGLFASDHQYSASLIRDAQRRLLRAFDPELDSQKPAFRAAQLLNVVDHYFTLSGNRTSVTALHDWRTMRRHRAWLRRLEGAAHAGALGQ